jgi:hypothetical protein
VEVVVECQAEWVEWVVWVVWVEWECNTIPSILKVEQNLKKTREIKRFGLFFI